MEFQHMTSGRRAYVRIDVEQSPMLIRQPCTEQQNTRSKPLKSFLTLLVIGSMLFLVLTSPVRSRQKKRFSSLHIQSPAHVPPKPENFAIKIPPNVKPGQLIRVQYPNSKDSRLFRVPADFRVGEVIEIPPNEYPEIPKNTKSTLRGELNEADEDSEFRFEDITFARILHFFVVVALIALAVFF
eukprot:CAMPEP_0113713840 /NCGR_PEP_ID=MMETSP0038_2-20120614/32244_1 /TAXON_ID=2898 /ORGANISM="Cryptomonas paramecium" /LENGTH=183 /DNA_ID=CAMNT_0000640669 /DNA_START=64 /DNA_END=612 /DNA_ORIENTATION=+ /assembly_acc=CAM_ASM_000170